MKVMIWFKSAIFKLSPIFNLNLNLSVKIFEIWKMYEEKASEEKIIKIKKNKRDNNKTKCKKNYN